MADCRSAPPPSSGCHRDLSALAAAGEHLSDELEAWSARARAALDRYSTAVEAHGLPDGALVGLYRSSGAHGVHEVLDRLCGAMGCVEGGWLSC
jgi:hypothetical protein